MTAGIVVLGQEQGQLVTIDSGQNHAMKLVFPGALPLFSASSAEEPGEGQMENVGIKPCRKRNYEIFLFFIFFAQ